MGRTLSLLDRSPRFEGDGLTHRRDCECVRCDAGFRPTERARAEARRRVVDRPAQEQAARNIARRLERERLDQTNMRAFVDEQIGIANAQIHALLEASERSSRDARLTRLWELRRAGWTLQDAIGAVEGTNSQRK